MGCCFSTLWVGLSVLRFLVVVVLEGSGMGELVRFPVERVGGGGWVSVGVVARELGVSVRTVERWRAEGCPALSAGRGRAVRFRLGEVEVWLRGR